MLDVAANFGIVATLTGERPVNVTSNLDERNLGIEFCFVWN